MMLLRLGAGCAAVALLAGCGLGAPAYPEFGEAAYRIDATFTEADGTQKQTTIYRDGPKMRLETALLDGSRAVIVFDQATDAAYVLQPVATAAVPTPASAPSTAPAATTPASVPASVPTSAPAAVVPPAAMPALPATGAGVAVRVPDSDAPKAMDEAWASLGSERATRVGTCSVAGEQGNDWRPRENAEGVERTACITSDGIVLRLREGEVVVFQATGVTRGVQDANLFGVPAGYQIIDPQAVVEQVGETMERLDGVASEPTGAAAAAPPLPKQN